mmetsp:Transcript_22002/g.68274  ORF Transcript_22002/g.68274 Transcript_22002/m.68274 type:complete len:245 (+) Transcript_22002:973-1707(+)
MQVARHHGLLLPVQRGPAVPRAGAQRGVARADVLQGEREGQGGDGARGGARALRCQRELRGAAGARRRPRRTAARGVTAVPQRACRAGPDGMMPHRAGGAFESSRSRATSPWTGPPGQFKSIASDILQGDVADSRRVRSSTRKFRCSGSAWLVLVTTSGRIWRVSLGRTKQPKQRGQLVFTHSQKHRHAAACLFVPTPQVALPTHTRAPPEKLHAALRAVLTDIHAGSPEMQWRATREEDDGTV